MEAEMETTKYVCIVFRVQGLGLRALALSASMDFGITNSSCMQHAHCARNNLSGITESSVCVCVCLCVYACTHVCPYAGMHVGMYIGTYAYMYACMYARMHVCISLYVYIYLSRHRLPNVVPIRVPIAILNPNTYHTKKELLRRVQA